MLLIGDKVKRNPGDRWMISGPRDYVPPIEVTIIESRYYVIILVNHFVMHLSGKLLL